MENMSLVHHAVLDEEAILDDYRPVEGTYDPNLKRFQLAENRTG